MSNDKFMIRPAGPDDATLLHAVFLAVSITQFT